MVKLASGDMVRFGVDSSKALLCVIGRDDAPRIEKFGYGGNDGDIVVLTGTQVALLLYRLTTANADGCVASRSSSSSALWVKTAYDEIGRVTVTLETDGNAVTMKAYERDLLASAVESQAWRLFP